MPGDWYLQRDRVVAGEIHLPPTLEPVSVAVIDSGIDGTHPALASSILGARSFVGGSPLVDTDGHGTFVAGEVVAVGHAAAGSTLSPIRLVVAKVVKGAGPISPAVEARAIRWAVQRGARVINLSLGGVRDPMDASLDTYSPLEAAAVRYAVSHDAVVVAAVGNGSESPSTPWPYADWPAALPHVIGVAAVGPGGGVPDFSNRDPRFVDLAAPGSDIVSTVPRALTAADPTCPDVGYSDCAGGQFRPAEGTSFAAPQVSAAAALLLSIEPTLTPDQVAWLLERSADDAKPATGCPTCPLGRDALTGWGTLDAARAVAALSWPLPPADPCATSNAAGADTCRLAGSSGSVNGDLDYWDHPLDVYRLQLRTGAVLTARLRGSRPGITLEVSAPTTLHASAAGTASAAIVRPGSSTTAALRFVARFAGSYYLEAEMTETANAAFSLTFSTVEASRSYAEPITSPRSP
jgi:subtilisin family serine protease